MRHTREKLGFGDAGVKDADHPSLTILDRIISGEEGHPKYVRLASEWGALNQYGLPHLIICEPGADRARAIRLGYIGRDPGITVKDRSRSAHQLLDPVNRLIKAIETLVPDV